MLSVYSSEHLQTDASEVRKLFFEAHLILDKQQTHYKNLIAKTFDGNTYEMKAAYPVWVMKNKKQCF